MLDRQPIALLLRVFLFEFPAHIVLGPFHTKDVGRNPVFHLGAINIVVLYNQQWLTINSFTGCQLRKLLLDFQFHIGYLLGEILDLARQQNIHCHLISCQVSRMPYSKERYRKLPKFPLNPFCQIGNSISFKLD